MKDIIERVLREQGLGDNGASPHGWRCEHPDRYPDYCTCVTDAVQAIAAELEAAGYRMVPWEYTQAAVYPPGDYTMPDDLPPTSRATHRRRHLSEPWERVPDDEEHEPTSITLSADGEP
jgi:hypothetical protein